MAVFTVVERISGSWDKPREDHLIGSFTLDELMRYLNETNSDRYFSLFVSPDDISPFRHRSVDNVYFHIDVNWRAYQLGARAIFQVLVDDTSLPLMTFKQLADFLSQIDPGQYVK